jgi:hypothetical protein
VEGALASAVSAASRHDSEALFHALDQRARFAISAMLQARKDAAAVIEQSYPESARAEALAGLGDARQVGSAAEWFAQHCPDTCMDELAARLASHGKYGVVWNTDALRRENQRAFAELDLIKRNAEMYAKQRALQ